MCDHFRTLPCGLFEFRFLNGKTVFVWFSLHVPSFCTLVCCCLIISRNGTWFSPTYFASCSHLDHFSNFIGIEVRLSFSAVRHNSWPCDIFQLAVWLFFLSHLRFLHNPYVACFLHFFALFALFFHSLVQFYLNLYKL